MHSITGTTRCYPLLGYPIAQVRTPPAINAYFATRRIDAVMFPMEIAPDAIDRFLSGLRGWSNCGGASVTVPYKQAAFSAMDRVTDRACRARAVNIIRREPDGTLFGDMTDGLAFAEALRRNGVLLTGRVVLVVGAAGGAGSAIAWTLCEAGPSVLCLVDPNAQKLSALSCRLQAAFPECTVVTDWPESVAVDIAINASPLGMGSGDPLPIDLDRLPAGAVVCDVVTKPNMTPLLLAARRGGHPIQTGNDMADAQLDFQMHHLELWQEADEAAAHGRMS
ncbi:shikimate dehydrogenase family protein [Chelativorans salis]|uniref:Shikimate dehydrogenase n=1 Tax=Chelativorans salis TaxID=2978478 RepID=A0ABT2LHZ2_9HYPH|nr:shikimate dehydrogenase [Chelativorans sp. EGI FJ00035]MCT7374195.1 shikimate dehydrogenase [Chelativorans sp. EGI FJ00035]